MAKVVDFDILLEFLSEKQLTLAISGIVTKWPFYTKTQVAVHVLIPVSQPHNVRICGIFIGHLRMGRGFNIKLDWCFFIFVGQNMWFLFERVSFDF